MEPKRFGMLRHIVVLGLVLLVLVSGCARGGQTPAAGTPAPAPAGPKQGGIAVWARATDPSTLDSAYAFSSEDIAPVNHIFETLVKLGDAPGKIDPLLATEWTESPDGTRWTFKLRQGVKFHDGTPFNAQAVVESLKRLYDKTNPYYQAKKYTYFTDLLGSVVTDVVPVSDYEVQIVLKHRFAPFLTYMAYYSQAIISPTALKQYGADFFKNPVGTGPFKFKEWAKGDKIVLVRNDQYWGKPAALDSIVLRVIPDATTRLFEMEQGNLHVFESPAKDQLARIRSNASLQMVTQTSASLLYVAFNHKKAPLDNVLVRKAIAHGVDWQRIVDTVWGESGKRANTALPEGVLGHDAGLAAYNYDPELAKSLLEQAGVQNLEIEMVAPSQARWSMPDPMTSLEMVQSDLAKIGIKLIPKPIDQAAVSAALSSGNYGLAWMGWKDTPDPNNFLNALGVVYAKKRWFYDSKPMADLAEQGIQAATPQERAGVYQKMQKILYDDYALIPVAFGRDTVVTTKKLQGVYVGQDGSTRLLNAYFTQ